MKTIVISTFNNSNNNYGALFQSCALAAFLRKLGYEACHITVRHRTTAAVSLKTKLKMRLKRILLLPKKRLIDERKAKFRRFAEQTQTQLVYENTQALCAEPPTADVYLSGSDQVWNPVRIHDDFFLHYAPQGAKKIAYAASMGHETIPAANEERFAAYIAQYEHVSVREDSMVPIIARYTDKPIAQHIDPVFLSTREEWGALESPYTALRFERFILVYAIEWNEEANRRLVQLKEETGLPAVSVCIGNIKKISAEQVIYNASPNEFLYLLGKASAVVATSFHGTAMSIVYNKPFVCFAGKDKPTRIQSLLRHFGIDEDKTLTADYAAINRTIEADREAARAYLVHAIEN